MSINVFQAILIGLWTAFCFSGMLLGIYTNRCIVLSFGVGIILGDLPTALAMGAIVNWLIWDSVLVLEVLFHQTQSDLVSLVP